MLAAYAAVASLVYGAILNLWFWPFVAGGETSVSFVEGAGLAENLSRFWAFHLTTSLGFDIPRAVFTAGFVLLAGRPILNALRRASRRAAFGEAVAFAPAEERPRVTSTPTVVVTRPLPEPGVAPLVDAGFRVVVNEQDRPWSAAELGSALADAEAVITMLSDRIDAALLDASPALRVVANFAVGFDNIDVAAARARGVEVTTTPGVLTEATADLAWALLLAASRRIGEGDRLVRSGAWAGWEPSQLLGRAVSGQRLGIVGHGCDRSGRRPPSRRLRHDRRLLQSPPSPGRRRAGAGRLVAPARRAVGHVRHRVAARSAQRRQPPSGRRLGPAADEAHRSSGQHRPRGPDRRSRPSSRRWTTGRSPRRASTCSRPSPGCTPG